MDMKTVKSLLNGSYKNLFSFQVRNIHQML